jgi:Aspartyl protease
MGYKDKNDTRYYVPLIIYSAYYNFSARFNFLLDTGASRTQLSWNDADYFGVVIRQLPPDANITGLGGTVRGYLLQQCTLIFKSNIGRYDLSLANLSVSDYETIDGRTCPVLPSVLGIDILDKFDLMFEEYGRVFLRQK